MIALTSLLSVATLRALDEFAWIGAFLFMVSPHKVNDFDLSFQLHKALANAINVSGYDVDESHAASAGYE